MDWDRDINLEQLEAHAKVLRGLVDRAETLGMNRLTATRKNANYLHAWIEVAQGCPDRSQDRRNVR